MQHDNSFKRVVLCITYIVVYADADGTVMQHLCDSYSSVHGCTEPAGCHRFALLFSAERA